MIIFNVFVTTMIYNLIPCKILYYR